MANIKAGGPPWFGKVQRVPSICSLLTDSKIVILANEDIMLKMFPS